MHALVAKRTKFTDQTMDKLSGINTYRFAVCYNPYSTTGGLDDDPDPTGPGRTPCKKRPRDQTSTMGSEPKIQTYLAFSHM